MVLVIRDSMTGVDSLPEQQNVVNGPRSIRKGLSRAVGALSFQRPNKSSRKMDILPGDLLDESA